ncbi:hypothetical protein BASA83_013613 [Batrachochytrium salamandrivorans]|nr:hypothetical protein BASA83_013613 [Batrachochytrium salamandrivorans]
MPYGLENDSTDDQLTAILHRLSQLETKTLDLLNWRTKGFSNIHQPLELLFLLNPSCYSNDNIKIATAGSLCTGTAAHGSIRWRPSINIRSPLHDAQVRLELERTGADAPISSGFGQRSEGYALHHEHPDSLDKLLLLATRIDARLLEHRQDRQLGRQTGTLLPDSFTSPVLPRNTSSHPTMMDVDAIRRQPLTPAEREHRFEMDSA